MSQPIDPWGRSYAERLQREFDKIGYKPQPIIVGNRSLVDLIGTKWGQPKIVGRRGIDYRYQCLVCTAKWVGPVGDWCDWCHERWLANRESEIQHLLFPEFMNWGERYSELSDIDKEVWERTRGCVGDFRTEWVQRIQRSYRLNLIDRDQMLSALGRYKKWTMTVQSKQSKKSFGT